MCELILNMLLLNCIVWNEHISMHKGETFQLKKKTWKMGQNPKSNEMLVTTKLSKIPPGNKSKMKFKDTSENAKRKKAAAKFQHERKKDFKA